MSNPKNAPQPQAHPQQLPVELPDEVAEGTYSNLMFCSHSASEFILDFARALPGARKGRVYARVVMTPQHAKALTELMQRNMAAFEEQHGAIRLPGRPEDAKIGFAPVAPGVAAPAAPSTDGVPKRD